MAQAILPGNGPTRFKGALAAGTEFASAGTAKERIYTGEMASLALRVKCSAITGTLTVALNPMLSDATKDDTTGTAAGTVPGPVFSLVPTLDLDSLLVEREVAEREVAEREVAEREVAEMDLVPTTPLRDGWWSRFARILVRLWAKIKNMMRLRIR